VLVAGDATAFVLKARDESPVVDERGQERGGASQREDGGPGNRPSSSRPGGSGKPAGENASGMRGDPAKRRHHLQVITLVKAEPDPGAHETEDEVNSEKSASDGPAPQTPGRQGGGQRAHRQQAGHAEEFPEATNAMPEALEGIGTVQCG